MIDAKSRALAVVAGIGLTGMVPLKAHAAGAAYQVDTAEVSEAGSCKVESWASFASNRDFFGAVSPACSVPFVRPLELSSQFNRSRSVGEADTPATPEFKANLISSAIGKPGVAVTGTVTYDFIARDVTQVNLTVPVTLRLFDVVRINVNGGWMLDRNLDRQFLTYGLGVDWRTPDNVWTLTTEVFGQAGNSAELNSTTQPRFQTGLRWRPIDRWNIDLIYGPTIMGWGGNWLTIATVMRFPPKGE